MVKIKAARVPGSKNKKKFKGKKVATTPKRGSKVMLKRKFKSSGKGTAGSQVKGSDARLKIISRSRSNIVDARDKLVSLAKGSDARQKLVKIRNLKEGKVSYITQHLLKIELIIGNLSGARIILSNQIITFYYCSSMSRPLQGVPLQLQRQQRAK